MEERKSEGHRIDYFIRAMRSCGCRFDSGQAPVFKKRGVLEFWEGEFFYKPGGIGLVGKVTLDHNFITVKSNRVISRKTVKNFREEIHLLLTTNQCHYYFESMPGEPDKLIIVLAKYIYSSAPPEEEVQMVLDMLAHAFYDLHKGIKSDFEDWKLKDPL